ncbi:MAG: hypothetical protein KGQ26_05840 [Rhodospirillales bacterium]|nr:hypothetical protein [Rhodospirillales bacterium]
MKPRAGHLMPAGLVLALLAAQAAGILAGQAFLPQHGHTPLAQRLLSWDGRFYFAIMQQGYAWVPAAAHTAQSIAFFPMQPLLEYAGAVFSGRASPLPPLLISLACGAASIFAFHALAREALNPRAASFATALFAFWPASSFFIMGYPTGLISLCVIGALGAHLRGQYWRSALWCGLGSAAAPTVVFVAAALYLERGVALLRQGATARRVAHLVAWALLCVSGLIGFMLYQQWRFHDALAFIHAQAAWGTAPAFAARLYRLADWHWYIQQANAGRHEIAQGLAAWRAGEKTPGMTAIEAGVQRWINSFSMIVAVLGLAIASAVLWRRAFIIALAGWFVFVGYVWFIFSTDQNMLCVPRLLYPAIAIFLGFGWLAGRAPTLGRAVLALSLFATGLEAAFAAGGYWVV